MQDELIREELERIATANNGLLRAEDVLIEAQKPNCILHTWKGFEWDPNKAAYKYNLQQARNLIRVTVEYVGPENDQTLSRVYVSLSPDRTLKGGGYRSLVSVIEDDDLNSQLFDDAVRELRRIQAKYATLKRLAGVLREIEQVVKETAPERQDELRAQ